jgi:hypothetical protein
MNLANVCMLSFSKSSTGTYPSLVRSLPRAPIMFLSPSVLIRSPLPPLPLAFPPQPSEKNASTALRKKSETAWRKEDEGRNRREKREKAERGTKKRDERLHGER